MLSRRSQRWIVVALSLIAAAGCGREETPPSAREDAAVMRPPADADTPTTPEDEAASRAEAAETTLNETDREFATSAFAANIAEVQAGRLAAEKTLNDDVRQFAQEMVKEHTAANEELMKLAKELKIELPTSPLLALKEDLQRLSSVTGPQHDRFYTERFGIHAHEQSLELYEREIREGQDGELKRFAERKVPVLRAHLERARRLRESVDTAR